MKYFIIAISLMLASPVSAMDAAKEHEENVRQQIKETPEISKYCIEREEYLKKKIKKYEDKLAEADKGWYRMKLRYYKEEYQDWKDYCKPKPEE